MYSKGDNQLLIHPIDKVFIPAGEQTTLSGTVLTKDEGPHDIYLTVLSGEDIQKLGTIHIYRNVGGIPISQKVPEVIVPPVVVLTGVFYKLLL